MINDEYDDNNRWRVLKVPVKQNLNRFFYQGELMLPTTTVCKSKATYTYIFVMTAVMISPCIVWTSCYAALRATAYNIVKPNFSMTIDNIIAQGIPYTVYRLKIRVIFLQDKKRIFEMQKDINHIFSFSL